MPIWLRNFTFQNINEFYEKEAEQTKKASRGVEAQPMQRGPAINQPSYTAKARK